MISAFVQLPEEPVLLTANMELDTFLQNPDFTNYDEDFVTTSINQAEADLEKLEDLYAVILDCPYHSDREATLTVSIVNNLINQYGIKVTKTMIYQQRGNRYYPSLEGLEFTWTEVWRFVVKITSAIVDAAMAFFNKRFTFVAQAYRQSIKLRKDTRDIRVRNQDELTKLMITPPASIKALLATSGQELSNIGAIEATLKQEAMLLDPKPYRDALETYVMTLSGFGQEDASSLLNIAEKARESVLLKVCQYLETQRPLNHPTKRVAISPTLMGNFHYQVEMAIDGMQAPSVAVVEIHGRTPKFKTVPCLTPQDVIGLSYSVEKALDVALNLRTEYDAVRKFKTRADDATKALEARKTLTGKDAKLIQMYRSLPSYVRLYSQPLKIRTELLYRYSIAILRYISASRQQWNVQVL